MNNRLFPRTRHWFSLLFKTDDVIIDEIEIYTLLMPLFFIIFIIVDILALIFKPFKIIYKFIQGG